MTESRRVLLIAGIDAVGIARLPALFARAGYKVTYLGSSRTAAARSRYIEEHFACEPGAPAAALAAREHLGTARQRYHSVVLADEPVLWAALDLGDLAWLEGWFPAPLGCSSIERLRSKVRFLQDSRSAGIAAPLFEVCQSPADLRAAAGRIGFPIFVKATRGLAGSGLIYARDRAHLDSQTQSIDFRHSVVAQQEIKGATGSISVLYDRGQPACWFSYIMKRTWPNRFSAASTIETCCHPDAGPLVESIGKLTGFHGLAGIDWMHDSSTGRLLLLEFNPRPTPAYYLGPKAGVDFTRALSDLASGLHNQQNPDQQRQIVHMFPQSLYDSVEHLRPLQFGSALLDAPFDDRNLAIAHFRRFLTHYVPKSSKSWLKTIKKW